MKSLFLPKKVAGSLITAGLVSGCTVAPFAVTDGLLDDAAWKQLSAHSLVQPQDYTSKGHILREEGSCRFLCANGNLYLSAEFDDSFLITSGEKDGDDLYHGDCCEIFIKPSGQPFYWEIWISPDGLRTVVKWSKKDNIESKGRLIEGREIRAAVTIKRTPAHGAENAGGWILNAAIPLPDVSGLEPGAWNILIARQNYDGSLSKETRELSSFPQLLKSSFHRTEEYFRLK